MNGHEHYAEAERLLAIAERGSTGMTDLTTDEISRMTAGAQVHAILALAAATALPTQRMLITDSLQGWFKAVEGVEPEVDD
ncbi:hypothetical protein [Streptacidiphilus cavernicola]|uniref:Uncharacterized protein n=1 Tax=Streptacidiphilus cavernicola TaxID=3342716 RepID=A0ABV6VXV7_9ACTN